MSSISSSQPSSSMPSCLSTPETTNLYNIFSLPAGITQHGNTYVLKFNSGQCLFMNPQEHESWNPITKKATECFREKINADTVQVFKDGMFYVHKKTQDYPFGSFSQCKIAYTPQKETVARRVTHIEEESFPNHPPRPPQAIENLKRTTEALSALQNVHGIAHIDREIRTHNKRGEEIHVQYQKFYDQHDLYALLEKQAFLPKTQANDIARQILQTISAMHERGIYHNDIKHENILLEKSKQLNRNGMYDIAICDFDFCSSNNTPALLYTGTLSYFSPEKASAFLQPNNRQGINNHPDKSDAWATGLTLMYLYFKTFPPEVQSIVWNRHQSDTAILQALSQVKKVSHWDPSQETKLILKLLNPDPDKRISVTEAYEQFKTLVQSPEESIP